MTVSGDVGASGHRHRRRRAAAEIEYHFCREFEPRQHEGRIDAALEAVAGVGIDTKPAAGLRDVDLVPQRRFDEHVGRRFRAAGFLTAHDAGQRFHPILVSDDARRVVERVGLAVERQQSLAGGRAPHREIAAHLGGVEYVQRPAAIEGDEIRDIDQRIDRTQSDRGKPLPQPFRRWAIFHPTHQAERESGAKFGRPRSSLRPGRETRP